MSEPALFMTPMVERIKELGPHVGESTTTTLLDDISYVPRPRISRLGVRRDRSVLALVGDLRILHVGVVLGMAADIHPSPGSGRVS